MGALHIAHGAAVAGDHIRRHPADRNLVTRQVEEGAILVEPSSEERALLLVEAWVAKEEDRTFFSDGEATEAEKNEVHKQNYTCSFCTYSTE